MKIKNKIKVLWFEVTKPSRYESNNVIIGGWQDSLENMVRTIPEIELYVCFESKDTTEIRIVDGVTYVPIKLHYSWKDRIKKKWTWDIYANKVQLAAFDVVSKIKPDIIQCFGSEWLWGLVAEKTQIPCVIHIQGSIVPYMNAQFPPSYNEYSVAESLGLKKMLTIKKQRKLVQSWVEQEKKVWKAVKYYMGRTEWDYALTKMMNPAAVYFHVEEALRPYFFSQPKFWKNSSCSKIRLFSTGCSTFWKGPDMMLKTARVLKENNVDFEWIVAGKMDLSIKMTVEHHEKATFVENNIKLLGFMPPEKIVEHLCNSTFYVHTAYIENSPNSICEAQLLGVPIISTNVGGISSLVREYGRLVPANDPWQMANAIIELSEDKQLMSEFSEKGRQIAVKRHSSALIKKQLMDCYMSILKMN